MFERNIMGLYLLIINKAFRNIYIIINLKIVIDQYLFHVIYFSLFTDFIGPHISPKMHFHAYILFLNYLLKYIEFIETYFSLASAVIWIFHEVLPSVNLCRIKNWFCAQTQVFYHISNQMKLRRENGNIINMFVFLT